MKWEKISNRVWIAKGRLGTWTITQCGKLFWGKYESCTKTFKMRPTLKLSEAKNNCQDNYYWERDNTVTSPISKNHILIKLEDKKFNEQLTIFS